MRVFLAAIRCGKGEVEQNLARHVRLLAEAAHDGCDLVLFPEMSLTGSVDPASHPERLMAADDAAVGRLASAAGEAGVAACFGIAERAADGRPYITQLFADGGRVTGAQRKRHLGQGEESYTAASGAAIFNCAGNRVGVAICAEAGFDEPFDAAAAAGGRLMLFPAAPGLYGRRTDEASWQDGFSWWQGCSLGDATRHASRLGLWVALAGQAGVTVDEDFPGLAALVGPDGQVMARLPDWREGTLVADIPLLEPVVVSHMSWSCRSSSWSISAARAFICSADGMLLSLGIIPRRANCRCLAVGPYPVSMRRIAEWHHHLVAAVDTGLTAMRTGRPIRDILPASPLKRGARSVPMVRRLR